MLFLKKRPYLKIVQDGKSSRIYVDNGTNRQYIEMALNALTVLFIRPMRRLKGQSTKAEAMDCINIYLDLLREKLVKECDRIYGVKPYKPEDSDTECSDSNRTRERASVRQEAGGSIT